MCVSVCLCFPSESNLSVRVSEVVESSWGLVLCLVRREWVCIVCVNCEFCVMV